MLVLHTVHAWMLPSQGLEEELCAFEADSTSLQGKVDEVKNLVGDQSFERGSMISLATEAGKVRCK